jgi:hypothetical protein
MDTTPIVLEPEVLEHGRPPRPPRPWVGRLLLAAAIAVGVIVVLHQSYDPRAQLTPAVAALRRGPLADAAAAALPVNPGTRAAQSLTVRGQTGVGPLRITPGEYAVDLVCVADSGRLFVRLAATGTDVQASIDCAKTPQVSTLSIETDPEGLVIGVFGDDTQPAGFAYRARKI